MNNSLLWSALRGVAAGRAGAGREPPEREVAAGARVDAVPSRVCGGVLGARDGRAPRVGRVDEPHVPAQRADGQVAPAARAADDGAREEPVVVAVAVAVIGVATAAPRGRSGS